MSYNSKRSIQLTNECKLPISITGYCHDCTQLADMTPEYTIEADVMTFEDNLTFPSIKVCCCKTKPVKVGSVSKTPILVD